MLFNSLKFFLFLVPVYLLYLRLNHRWQNRLLLVASYVFYGSWDWRFLSLILLTTTVDYFCALNISRTENPVVRKRFLMLSIFSSLSILGFFKYFNFFAGNLGRLLNVFGIAADPFYLNIILPVGISFYTFQTMSYTIDVYRKALKPTDRFFDFALYVSFFPQLVAGPIERAVNLLPQVLKPRIVRLDKFYEGCFLIFWGLFLKAVIADNLAKVVETVYAVKVPPFNGMEVLFASYAFTFQIYCDFAGYSHIARGLGKIMGFELMINFNLPFFVTNVQDFWNRWHISLSSWLRDYLYIPLFRGMRFLAGNVRVYAALMINMTVIGLWHGAGWNYILFGVYYGCLLCAYTFIRMHCQNWIVPKSGWGKALWYAARVVFMFQLISIGMLLFRSINGASVALHMLSSVIFNFTMSENVVPMISKTVYFIWILLAVQVIQYRTKDVLCVYKAHPVWKVLFYVVCIFYFTVYGVTNGNQFIYFQF
ncbi:MAG: MBOAT family O-acyltransferase [Candidatus Omnitrophota bacterium]|nr:MBOAT family O-acyltransferase [Candidatus Omnitrophota bacterium]